MNGLDTNILVRYLTRDDQKQFHKAEQVIDGAADRGEALLITTTVLCELVWVLASAYGHTRTEIAESLDHILRTRTFQFEDKALLCQALADYEAGQGGFADYVIGRAGHQAGCVQTLTFDKALKSSPLFRVL